MRVHVTVGSERRAARVAVGVSGCSSTRSGARCARAGRVTLAVPAGGTRTLDRTFAVTTDAVDVAVTAVREHPTLRETYGDLLVGAHGTWGLAPLGSYSGASVARIAVLLSGESSSSARASVAWTGSSSVARTLITSLAGHPIGDPVALAEGGAAGSFSDRPSIARTGDRMTASVDMYAYGARLASIALPFPR